ncbi:Homeodomain-like DNA binding domain-containing transcription factor [Phycomyces blakesleeanus NRRL 1555(-)]|uniref:Homeodomain-like DNA binding domain-containing transcription factor n=1 Tax=Phycomyces blakesleeanus (strain ATCC 8743b / DSM 1359 / FGSC 10004 / NBRC 33097 / NRRL 1555) TaxID=763407 RepID=A0A167QP25_PHYB8|nr:Homeodomain-like DNA binding domain-containing transcription factor [Phycomyces blakesleeanus NRRL 1555(-)]OAD79990.1 Homeodomain-like DNA binding domain-containing transcription factor [Phycomyces blakesleeanus NRRL 1555(-)]|eukprot:XP_018298030.1 Homeodomain-like DNA binding domain-containing transcription factor [Phycomyces blakesleeanus NRRL 1555(-)]
MQDANSSENTHGSYEKADPYKYRCIMYMHLANYGATQISLVVGMSLSTIKCIIKRVDKTGSPEPRKGSGRPRKIDERTEKHLVQIFFDHNKKLFKKRVYIFLFLRDYNFYKIHLGKLKDCSCTPLLQVFLGAFVFKYHEQCGLQDPIFILE